MFYVVNNGRKPGIYKTWAECKEQVHGFSNAVFKKCKTIDAANAMRENYITKA